VEQKKFKDAQKLYRNYSCMLYLIRLTHKGSISQDHYLEPEFAYADWVIVHVFDNIMHSSNK